MMRRFEGVWPLFLVAALACGDSPSETEPEPDPEPEPTAGEASLQLMIGGEPLAGQPLHVSRPDGSFQETVVTDAEGWVTAEIDAGSLFSWGSRDEFGLWAVSVVVSPGDELRYAPGGSDQERWELAPSASMEGANYYHFVSCLGRTDPDYAPTLTVSERCLDDDGGVQTMALAYNDDPSEGGQLLGYQVVRKQLDSEVREDTIEFSGEWRTELDELDTYVAGFGPPYTRGRDYVRYVDNGRSFPGLSSYLYERGDPVPFIPNFGDDLIVDIGLDGESTPTSFSSSTVAQLASEGISLDADDFLVPPQASLDPTQKPWAIKWAGGADGVSGSVLLVDEEDNFTLWTVIGPAGPIDIALPELPAETGLTYPSSPQFVVFDVGAVDFPDADGFAEVNELGRLADLERGTYSDLAERLLLDGQRLRVAKNWVTPPLDAPLSAKVRDRMFRARDARLRQRR
jgi:hypothetical protein